MKKVLSVLIITFCITGISPLANAALALNMENLDTATVLTDTVSPVSCYLSIPSHIDYIIDPAPPISIYFDGELDGLDWIYITNANPLIDPPAGILATLTLTGPEMFAIAGPYELNLWDETATSNLGTLTIVPEPATLMLLGLGGLLIRKRK